MVVVFFPPSWKLFITIHQIAKLPDERFQIFQQKHHPRLVSITPKSQIPTRLKTVHWVSQDAGPLSERKLCLQVSNMLGPTYSDTSLEDVAKKKSTMRDPMSHMVDVGSMVGTGLSRTPQVISVGEHFATKTTFMDPHLHQNIDRMWKEASLDSNPIKMMVPCIPQARLFHMHTYITVCMNIYIYISLRCWGSAGHTREGVGGGGVGMIHIYIYIDLLVY